MGCYRASRGLTRLSNLVMLDLQPMMGIEPGDNGEVLRDECVVVQCVCVSVPAIMLGPKYARPVRSYRLARLAKPSLSHALSTRLHRCWLRCCPTCSDTVPCPCCPAGAAMGPGAAAAWKVPSLTELRWCGDVVFDAGEVPIHLPRLLALEIE